MLWQNLAGLTPVYQISFLFVILQLAVREKKQDFNLLLLNCVIKCYDVNAVPHGINRFESISVVVPVCGGEKNRPI